MKASLSCLQCCLTGFFTMADEFTMEEKQVKEFFTFLAGLEYDVTPVEILKASHDKIRKLIGQPDPYLEKKKLYNQKMLERYSYFSEAVNQAADPIKKAVIIAIGGNVIDFLPKDNQDIDSKIDSITQRDLAIDQVSLLVEDLKHAGSILFVTDNCGEIVLDKLLIQTLIDRRIVDPEKLVVATRGFPIINDATLEDAEAVGLTQLVKVINSGDNAPGVILASTSKAFQDHFEKADVIISKGMGNFETLDSFTDKKIYFLFVAKCRYAAEKLGVPVDGFICARSF